MAVVVPVISTFDARGIDRAIRDFKKLEGSGERAGYALRTMDSAAQKVAKSLMKVGGLAVVAGGFAAKAFIDFDASMNKSLAIMGDVSESMRTRMADGAREMAKQTTFSAQEAAESYFFLASAGLDAEQSLLALPRVAKFAQAGMFDMALATDLLTDAQSALGLTIRNDAVKNMENMTRVSDVLVKANTLANATVEQFSTSLTNKAGAALRATNKDIEEGVAVLAAFADQGIKGEEAGTQFSIVMRDLQTKALQNAAAFKQANVQVFDQNGKMNNLGTIVQQLEKRLGSMSVAQKRAELATLGFSDKSVSAITALLGTSDAIINYEKQLRSAAGTTDEISAKQLESLKSQLNLTKSAFLDLAIAAGERMAPVLGNVTKVLQHFATIVGEQGLGKGFNFLTGQILGSISKMGLLGKALFGLVGAFVALRVATITYTASMTALNVVTTLTDGALKALIVRLGAAKVAMMAAGGVVALLSAAAIIYGVYAKRKSESIQATKDFRDALELEGKAQEDALLALYRSNPAYRNHIDTLKTMNITLQEANQFVQFGSGALKNLADQWVTADKGVSGINPKLKAYADALGISTEGGFKQIAMVRNMVIEMMKQRKETLENARAQANLAMAMGNTAEASLIMQRALGADPTIKVTSKQASDDLTKAEEELAKALEELNKGVGGVGSGIDKLNGKVETAKQKFQKFADAAQSVVSQQRSLRDAVKSVTDAQTSLTSATTKVVEAQTNFVNVTKGYSAASKEAIAAQKNLATAQRDSVKAGYNLADAQESLTKATTSVADAQKNFTNITKGYGEGSKEAIKAQKDLEKAQRDSAKSGFALADAQRAVLDAQRKIADLTKAADPRNIQEAQDNLTQAQFKLVDAEKELARARRMRRPREIAEAEIALRQATNGVADANLKLAEAQASADPALLTQAQQELATAELNVTEAEVSQQEATENLTAAQETLTTTLHGAKEGTDAYKEAVNKLEEAQKTQRDAVESLKDAQEGNEQATKNVSTAQEKLNETINGAKVGSDSYKEALNQLEEAQKTELDAIDSLRSAKEREIETTKSLVKANLLLQKSRKKLTKKQIKQAERLVDKLQTPVSVPSPTSMPSMPSFNLADFDFSGLDLSNIDFSGIGGLAKGGIVTKPTLSFIGEGGEPEAVIPLSRLGNMGGDVYNITINSKIADATLPDVLVAELRKFNRRSGAINIQVA